MPQRTLQLIDELAALPDTLKNIPHCACYEMRKLREVHLPAAVEQIGNRAFSGCAELREVEFPASLRRIGEGAFVGSGLTEVTLPAQCEIATDSFPPGIIKINKV